MSKRIHHHLDPEIAEKVGVNAALLYGFIRYHCAAKEAEGEERAFHDGRYWIFNSISSFAKLFPYLSEKQIRVALQQLEDASFIRSGVFNNQARDRTKWYTDLLAPICPTGQMDLPHRADVICPTGQTITIDTHRHNKNTVSDKPDTAFEDMWKAFPKSGFPSKQNALKAYSKLSQEDRLSCCAGARSYANWHEAEKRRRPDTPAVHLATFINQRRWEATELKQKADTEAQAIDRMAYLKRGVWLPDWGPKPELAE